MKIRFPMIIGILLLGAILRFYKLDWASGLFTHPDEYHIVSSVAQLSFPTQMNPHFFSYGTITIYLIYFTQELIKYLFTTLNYHFVLPNSFLIGRFYSALFSTLTIFVIYEICLIFFTNKRFSLITALLVGLSPGLIQQAHFATPESALTFFIFGSLFFSIKFLKQNKIIFLILSAASLGFALGVKISSAVFLLPLTIIAITKSCPKKLTFKTSILIIKQTSKELVKFIKYISIIITITTAVLFVVAPYVFLDFTDFRNNFEYEGGLAMGKLSVFYTRQFINTIPVLFQLEKILPYTLGPVLLVFSILGFFAVMLNLFQHLISWAKIPKQVRNDTKIILILIISFLSLFLANAFLFAKWTRFIAPTFPFFAIFAAFLLDNMYLKNKFISKIFTFILIIGTFLWTAAFFSIYLRPDVRITASNWIENNLPINSSILVEGGNMIDIPLKGNFNRTSLDFYNLETDIMARKNIAQTLVNSSYFIIQSRRVFMNHQRLPKLFPITANFYNVLFDGELGFKQIKEFHSYPTLAMENLKWEFSDEKAEETWSVFDHPVIRVFKKTQQLPLINYEKILGIE